MIESTWNGCYDASWKRLICDAAFAHPAKMARGLLVRIFDYLFDRGHVTRGTTIIDPFGGIGTTGIEGASRGCQVVCVELEEKFVKLAQQNFALHQRTWEQMGDPLPVILQGDSRRLCAILSEAQVCVSSPPYAGSETTAGNAGNAIKRETWGRGKRLATDSGYGTTPGQLGAMPEGAAIVGSPPFSGTEQPCQSQSAAKKDYHAFTRGNGTKRDATMTGQTPGQLGALPTGDLILSSPPYADQITGANAERETADESRAKRKTPGGSTGASIRHGGYGQSPGNLSALVSSPPYEESASTGVLSDTMRAEMRSRGHKPSAAGESAEYGNTEGQIGNSQGETFWSAAAQIVQQCYQTLPPGGIAVWVVKRYVRNKQIVDFSDQWRQMCEACGFETVEWIRAMLTKEWTENSLFEGPRVRRKERKSFFRRLAEKKGSPRIDHEDILVMRRS